MFKLIWLLGWLRPRTAIRRIAMLAAVGGTVGAGTFGAANLFDSLLETGRAAADDVISTAGRLLPGSSSDPARVTHVVDGDTLDVRMRVDGRRREVTFRLIGIDSPESKKPGTPIECGALEAEHHLLKRRSPHPATPTPTASTTPKAAAAAASPSTPTQPATGSTGTADRSAT